MEESERKRGRERRAVDVEEIEGLGGDPMALLGLDLMMKVLDRLDARSLALCLIVSRDWNRVASSDELWASKVKALAKVKLEQLWLGKAHIPRVSQVRGVSKLAAYSLSVIDGKRGAPQYWRNIDPSWIGTGPPMRRYFHPDGRQTADPDDKAWGGHECSYSIVTSFVNGGRIRQNYVRINRWPRMNVNRKQDWSWEMANDLYCYLSIPDADKPGGTGPLNPVW
ncbi:hypothetical protein Sjap_006190 [Stephania japonica]|uniref:F-box domain-containing protein n=1 Tax=Stephania japonica TaxID=461633 RepID=A0AAP0PJI0_9MAGN